jgi:SOS-response transcriptional repressor LexA
MTSITQHQRVVFKFIRDWQLKKKYSPSLRDIAWQLGYSSYTSPSKHIDALCAAGLLQKDHIGRIKIIPQKSKKSKWKPFKAPTLSMGRCYLKLHALSKA